MRMTISLSLMLLAAPAIAQERALVDLDTGDVIQYQTPAQPQGIRRWYPVTRLDRPTFDPATQYLTRTVVVTNEQVIVDWIVNDYTQEQLDARAARQVEQQESDTKRTSLQDNIATLRSWADQAETTTVTSGNAVNVLQTLVDRSGTFYDRFADLIELQYGE